MIKNKKNILLAFIFGVVAFSGTVLAINSWNTGYRLPDDKKYDSVTFNYTNSISNAKTDKFKVVNAGSSDVFIPTRTVNEFSSFLMKTPPRVWGHDMVYNISTTEGCHAAWSVGCYSRLTNDKNILIPVKANYRFYMYTERENDQPKEDFKLYVDLNKDGDFNDAGEYLFTSNDRSQEGETWEWARVSDSLTSERVMRTLNRGTYKFRMKMKNASDVEKASVDIYQLRVYAW